MDLTRFAEAAERLHVLGIKVTKDDELIGEWYYEPECLFCDKEFYLVRCWLCGSGRAAVSG